MLHIEKTTIEIGLEKPLKILHVTDNHLPLCDTRDDERKQALAARKADRCGEMVDFLKEEIGYARENCDMLVHIPMKGQISSLNASAAASILLYEAVRQRRG